MKTKPQRGRHSPRYNNIAQQRDANKVLVKIGANVTNNKNINRPFINDEGASQV